MRRAVLALTLAAIALPAAAQDRALERERLRDLQAQNRLQMQQTLTRQQVLAAERQAFAAEQRARLSANLGALEARPPVQPAPLDPTLAAQAQATANAQARFLAESNARIRALTAGARD